METERMASTEEGAVEAIPQGYVPLGSQVRVRWQWPVVLVLVFSDVLLALLAWEIAFTLQSEWGRGTLSALAVTTVTTNIIVWVGMRAMLGLYPGYGLDEAEGLRRQTYAVLATLTITSVFALSLQVGDLLSRLLLGLGFLGLLFLAPLLRYFMKRTLLRAGLWGKPVAIIGAGENGVQLAQTLRKEWQLGFVPVAVFEFLPAPGEKVLAEVPFRETATDVLDLARKQRVDTVIFATPYVLPQHLATLVEKANYYFQSVIVIPNLATVTTSTVVARNLAGTLGLESKHNLLNPWTRRIKRSLDLFGVLVGGLLISPLLLVIAALIKLSSPGPVFYKQVRPGARGKYFGCWKFRTMRGDAELVLTELLRSDQNLQAEWERDYKLRDDPRTTRIGRFLRRTSLDELPQLWNVLRGEMSLVGPRPILVEEIPKYGEGYELYKRVRPGITGLWQVSGRNDTSYEERVALDVNYIHNWSVWWDLIILSRTIRSVISGRGAY